MISISHLGGTPGVIVAVDDDTWSRELVVWLELLEALALAFRHDDLCVQRKARVV